MCFASSSKDPHGFCNEERPSLARAMTMAARHLRSTPQRLLSEPLPDVGIATDELPWFPRALVSSVGDLDVFVVQGADAPRMLEELVGLRGQAQPNFGQTPRDCFIIIVRHRRREELVGACLLSPVDSVLDRTGAQGLCASASFSLHPRLVEKMRHAWELSDWLVSPSYASSPKFALALLKGLGVVVSRRPQRFLFLGQVPIVHHYSTDSLNLMAAFFAARARWIPEARLVKARCAYRTPFAFNLRAGKLLRDIPDEKTLSRAIAAIERGERQLPPMLRLCLGLGGKALGFHFETRLCSGSVLMLLNLSEMDSRRLKGALVPRGEREFVESHQETSREHAEAPISPGDQVRYAQCFPWYVPIEC